MGTTDEPGVPFPGSLGAAASLQAVRRVQLQHMDPADIQAILDDIRQAQVVPAVQRHARHFTALGVADEQEYQDAFRRHLQRQDLRSFSYLRPNGQVPIWELVAPDTGITVLYNEDEQKIWSFFRPKDGAKRMNRVQDKWLEIFQMGASWHFEDQCRW